MSLPNTATAAHGIAFARFAAAASWTRVAFAEAGEGVAPLARVDPSARTSASLRGVVSVRVANYGAANQPVFFTAKEPAEGADGDDGIRVDPGVFIALDVLGTATPPELWVYGDAAEPVVEVVLTLGADL